MTLWANSSGGNAFNYWSGDASGAANPTTVTMNGNKSITANFAQPCYTLTKGANPSAGGSVSADPTPNCNGGTQYMPGTVVTLTANPNSGYTFSSWSGDASGNANPIPVTMNSNKNVTANFTTVKVRLYLAPASVNTAVNSLFTLDVMLEMAPTGQQR